MRGCFAIGDAQKDFELRSNSAWSKVPFAGNETIEARSLGAIASAVRLACKKAAVVRLRSKP
jgi:hypothetical protein